MSVLAHGTYRYTLNGALTGITEPWQLERAETGYRLCGRRLRDGMPLLAVEADYDGTQCRSLHLRWLAADQTAARTLLYQHDDNGLQWTEDAVTQSIPVPQDSLLFPLLRAATGPLLLHLAASPRWVVLPSLHHAHDASTFLRPLLSQRRAQAMAPGATAWRHFRYYGGEYGEAGSDCWLDAMGLLQRYRWDSPQGVWDVRNEESTAAAGFEGFR
jgi:hypothetical protein